MIESATPITTEAPKRRRYSARKILLTVVVGVILTIVLLYVIGPRTNPHLERANTLFYQGNYEAAIDEYTLALQQDPNNAGVYNARGISYADTGNHEAALADFNRAIQ